MSIRVIPSLLIDQGGLVKTIKFKDPTYIGDPINAVKIFNDKEVDELVLLDISATREERGPNFSMIQDITSEAFMPIGYGGGITSLDDIHELLKLGVEKVLINSGATIHPKLISEAANVVGSQSIVASVDVKKNLFGRYDVYSHGGRKKISGNPVEYTKMLVDEGAGEILLTSIDNDGTMSGYDLQILQQISHSVSVPVIASGGAGSFADFSTAISVGGASAVTAGSIFVFHGPHRAVLISYPTTEQITELNNISLDVPHE